MNCRDEIQCSSFLLRGSFYVNAHSLQLFMYPTTVKKPDDDHNDDTLYIMCICSIFHGLCSSAHTPLVLRSTSCSHFPSLILAHHFTVSSSQRAWQCQLNQPNGISTKKWNCSRRRFWKTNTTPYYRKGDDLFTIVFFS